MAKIIDLATERKKRIAAENRKIDDHNAAVQELVERALEIAIAKGRIILK